jgi:hypothetical protein
MNARRAARVEELPYLVGAMKKGACCGSADLPGIEGERDLGCGGAEVAFLVAERRQMKAQQTGCVHRSRREGQVTAGGPAVVAGTVRAAPTTRIRYRDRRRRSNPRSATGTRLPGLCLEGQD